MRASACCSAPYMMRAIPMARPRTILSCVVSLAYWSMSSAASALAVDSMTRPMAIPAASPATALSVNRTLRSDSNESMMCQHAYGSREQTVDKTFSSLTNKQHSTNTDYRHTRLLHTSITTTVTSTIFHSTAIVLFFPHCPPIGTCVRGAHCGEAEAETGAVLDLLLGVLERRDELGDDTLAAVVGVDEAERKQGAALRVGAAGPAASGRRAGEVRLQKRAGVPNVTLKGKLNENMSHKSRQQRKGRLISSSSSEAAAAAAASPMTLNDTQ